MIRKQLPIKPSSWDQSMISTAKRNAFYHSGTIRSGELIVHTLVNQCVYRVYVYNVSKNIYEEIGLCRFIGDDALHYQFEIIQTPMSNIDYHTITISKLMDDRYFFAFCEVKETTNNDTGSIYPEEPCN